MTLDTPSLSAQDQLQELKARQYMQSSLESIHKELDEVLQIIGSELDVEDEYAEATSDEQNEMNSRTREAMATAVIKLQQVNAALGMTSMTAATQLIASIESALQTLVDRGATPTNRQRQAIFSSFFMVVRYLAAMQADHDAPAGDFAPVLSPSFFELARAGLTPFVDEHKVARIDFELVEGALGTLDPTDDIAALRRHRKMYQLALIGLLAQSPATPEDAAKNSNEQLKLIAHVAERMSNNSDAGDEAPSFSQNLWLLLSALVAEMQSEKIALTNQRRHFFSRFDSLLRATEKANGSPLDTELATRCLAETLYLLDLAGCRDKHQLSVSLLCSISPAQWSDAEIDAKRVAIESGLKDALAATTSAINDIMVEVKHRLGLMAESEVCEEGDVEYLSKNICDIAKVVSFCGLSRLGGSVQQILPVIESWNTEVPTQENLLKVADAVLAIENALLSYALCGDSAQGDDNEVDVQAGLKQQANLHLFEELGSNIELASRAINSYIESNGDREHIANISECLRAAVGGLKIVGATLAADLLSSCAKVVEQEYKSTIPTDAKTLESLADSLISVDYMLHELASGRDGGVVMKQLLQQNLDSVEHQLNAA